MRDLGLEALLLYGDREHFANLAYLTGFDPRFEEAVLVMTGETDPVIVTGPENQGVAAASRIAVNVVLYPPFGLLGQDRSKTPALVDVLADAGLRRGQHIGVAGWKYFGSNESPTPETWLEIPSFIADALRGLAGPSGRAVNATAIFMDSSSGLRAANEVDQLAQFEFAASHASEAIKQVIFGVRPGMEEFEAAQLMRPLQLPVSCHPMLSTGDRAYFGLLSPSSRIIENGDPFTTAFGLWGGLTCRAGWIAASEDDLPSAASDYVEKLAGPYYDTAVAWYETIGIGVPGGDLDALVRRRLGDPFFNIVLNPGHLIHYDEWMNSPVYPGSAETLRSGQAIQLDIIPATGSAYFTSNIEDGIALLDEPGRAELAERYPDAWTRIQARRAFMKEALGITLKPEVLPFSNLAGYLSPFILSPNRVLVRK